MRVILLATVALIACGQPPNSHPGPDAGGDAGPPPQGSPARGALVINEFSPQPTEGADWIELLNRSDEAIDLCGLFVTDDLERLDHYTPLAGVAPPQACEPSWMQPGEFLIIEADDSPELHHGLFRLGQADEIHIVTTQGLATDSVIYLYPSAASGESLARIPSGEGVFYLAPPSRGEPNPENL